MYVPDMSQNKEKRFEMRADSEFIQALDQLRRDEPDLPSRAEMVRRLVVGKVESGRQAAGRRK